MKDVNGKLQYKDKELTYVFNLNVMEQIQEQYGTVAKWAELTDPTTHECDVKALKVGFTFMLNEAIDMENEANGTNIPFYSTKQVGRILTAIGVDAATRSITETVINSVQSGEKNVSSPM